MTRRRHRKVRRWAVPVTVTTVALVMTAGLAYTVTSVFDQPADAEPKSGGDSGPLVVQAVAADTQPASYIAADPENAESALALQAPQKVEPGSDTTFEVRWSGDGGRAITGELDVQRIKGREWTTVESVAVESGNGTVTIPVQSSGLYRAAYGGSPDYPAGQSAPIAVLTGDPMASRLITTVEGRDDDETAAVTAAWITMSEVAIVGELELQVQQDDGWSQVSTVVTDTDGTAVVEVEASETARYRFVYTGGARFAKAESEPAVLTGGDVRTVPVSVCSTGTEIDNLGNGEGCHYTPVGVGNFVVGHDYLGNAWWNTVSMGTHIKLEGAQAGLYEVVDRVMAPARGSALGPASNWTCGNECDVILQTCRGDNTGFTWLRRVDEQI